MLGMSREAGRTPSGPPAPCRWCTVFAGLVLTSISTVMIRAGALPAEVAVRPARNSTASGRTRASRPRARLGSVVDGDDLDRPAEGGVYSDPHEISSLYATDATPDLPVTKPTPRTAAKAAPKAAPRRGRKVSRAADEVPAESAAAVSAEMPMKTMTPTEVDDIWTGTPEPAPTGTTSYESDQIWVQPAHTRSARARCGTRPSVVPMQLAEETFEPLAEERVASSRSEMGSRCRPPALATSPSA